MSFIHYKFKSSKDYDTLTFDGLHISLGDLKKAILQHKKQAKSIDFDLQIVNAQSREVYKDDEELIPKNTSVVVARIPVGRQSTSKPWEPSNRDAAYVGSQPNKGMESAITLERLKQTPDLVNAFASEEDKIKAMMTQSTKDYDQTNYMKPRFPSTAIRPGYVCYKCNKPGHHIANCTAKTENDAPVRMRRAHGIPANFLTPVSAPDSNLPGVLMTIRGQLAVPTIDAKAYLAGKKEKPPFVSSKDDDKPVADDRSVPRELLCLICDQISTDAVVIACCGNSYCDECIREALLSSESHTCPTCGKSGQSPDQLIANRFLRTAIQNYRNETGYANVTSSKQPAVVPQQPAALTQQPAVLPQQSAAVPQQQAPPTSIAYNNTPPQIHHDPPTSHSHTVAPPVSLPTAVRAVGGSPYQQDVGTPPQSSHKADPPKHQPIQQHTDIPVMLSPPRSMPPRSALNPSSSALPYDNNHQATPPSDSLSFNNSQAIVRVTTSTRRYPTPDVPRQDGFEGNNFYNRPGQRPLDGPPGSRPHEGQGPTLPQDPPPMHLMSLPVHSGGSMPPRPDFPRMDGPGARPPPPIGLPPHQPNMGPIMSMPPHIPPPVRGPPMARPPMGMLNGPPPPIMNRPLGPHPLIPEPMNRPMMNRNDGRMPNYPPPHGGPPPPPGTGPMPSAPPGMGGPRFPPPPAAHIPPLTEEQFYKEKDRLRRVSEKKVKPDPMDDFAKELMKPRVRPVRPISKSRSRSRSRSVSRPRKFSRSRSRSRSKARLRTRSRSRSHSRTRKLSFSRSRSQSRSRARSRTRSPRPSRKKSWSRSPRPYKRSRSPLSVSPRPKPHSRSRSPRPPTRGRRSQSPVWRHRGRSPDLPRRRSRSPYYGRRGSPGPSVESGRSRYRRGRSPSPYRSKAYPMPFPHQGPQSMPPGGDYVSDDYRFPDSQDARWAEYFNYYRQYFDHYHDHSTSYSGGPPYSPGNVSHSTRDRWPPMGSRTPPPPTRPRSRSGSRSRYHPRDSADRHRDHEKYRERESSRSHKYKEDDHMDYKERDRKPALDERVQSKERKREKEHKKDRKKSKKDKKPKELRGSSSSKVKEKVASSRDSKDLPLPPLCGHTPSDFSSSTDLTETDSDLEEKRVQKKMESCKRTKELVKKKESRDGQRSGEKHGMSNNSQEKSYKVSTQSEADKRPKHYAGAAEVKLKKPSSSDSKEKLDGDAKTPHPNKPSSDVQPESKMQGKLVSKPIEVMGDKMTRTEVSGAVVSPMSLEASGRMKNDKSTVTKSNLIHVKPVKDVMIPRTVAVQKKPRSRSNTPTADTKKRSRSRTPSGQGQDKVSVVPVKKMKQVEKPESRLKVKATGSPGIQKHLGGASKAKFEGIYDLEGSDGNLESPVKESVLVAEPPQLSKWERSDPSSEPDEDIDKKKKHMKIEEKKPLPKSVIETAEKVLANKPRQGAVVSSHIHRVTRSPSPNRHQSPPSSKRWRSLQSPEHRSSRQSPEHRSSRQSPEHRSSRQSPEHRSTRPSLERKTSDRRGTRPSPDRKSSRRSPEYRSSRRSPERRSSRQSPEYRSSRRMPEHRNSRQSPKRRSSKQSPEHSGPRASQDPRGSPKRRQVVTSQRSVQVTVSTKESKRSIQGSDDDLSYDLRDKLKGSQRKGFISGSDKRNVVHMDSGELTKKEAKKSSSFERKVSVIDESVFEPDYDETYDSDADPAPGSKGAVTKSCEVVTESSASRLDSDTQPDSDSDSRSDSKSKRSQDESKSKPKKQKSKHKKEKKEKKHKKKSKKKHKDV